MFYLFCLPRTVVFACPHGGAKSVIAASYFNRIAAEEALPYVAVAVAAEDPYAEVPPAVAALLGRDGFDVRAFRPRHIETKDVENAARVVTIDCDVAGAETWDDVPLVSVDPEASAAAIRRHVLQLAKELHD